MHMRRTSRIAFVTLALGGVAGALVAPSLLSGVGETKVVPTVAIEAPTAHPVLYSAPQPTAEPAKRRWSQHDMLAVVGQGLPRVASNPRFMAPETRPETGVIALHWAKPTSADRNGPIAAFAKLVTSKGYTFELVERRYTAAQLASATNQILALSTSRAEPLLKGLKIWSVGGIDAEFDGIRLSVTEGLSPVAATKVAALSERLSYLTKVKVSTTSVPSEALRSWESEGGEFCRRRLKSASPGTVSPSRGGQKEWPAEALLQHRLVRCEQRSPS